MLQNPFVCVKTAQTAHSLCLIVSYRLRGDIFFYRFWKFWKFKILGHFQEKSPISGYAYKKTPLFQKCRKQGGTSYNVVSGPSQIRLITSSREIIRIFVQNYLKSWIFNIFTIGKKINHPTTHKNWLDTTNGRFGRLTHKRTDFVTYVRESLKVKKCQDPGNQM